MCYMLHYTMVIICHVLFVFVCLTCLMLLYFCDACCVSSVMLDICDDDASAVGFEAAAKPHKLNGLEIVDPPMGIQKLMQVMIFP